MRKKFLIFIGKWESFEGFLGARLEMLRFSAAMPRVPDEELKICVI